MEECRASRLYAAKLIEIMEGGVWGEVAAKLAVCDQLGQNGQCLATDGCARDYHSTCSASNEWVTAKIAEPEARRAGALGVDGCGLFGALLSRGAACQSRNSASCVLVSDAAQDKCMINIQTGTCDLAPQAVVALLHKDYPDELARLAFQRDRCTQNKNETTCSGKCQWRNSSSASSRSSAGQCQIRSLEAVLTVSGEDCPLRTLATPVSECDGFSDENTCPSIRRRDGGAQCIWTGTFCEVNNTGMEVDLIRTIASRSVEIAGAFEAAQVICSNRTTEEKCAPIGECAPQVVKPSAPAPTGVFTIPGGAFKRHLQILVGVAVGYTSLMALDA